MFFPPRYFSISKKAKAICFLYFCFVRSSLLSFFSRFNLLPRFSLSGAIKKRGGRWGTAVTRWRTESGCGRDAPPPSSPQLRPMPVSFPGNSRYREWYKWFTPVISGGKKNNPKSVANEPTCSWSRSTLHPFLSNPVLNPVTLNEKN